MIAATNEMLKLLNLSAPLLYALTTYGLFHFLDRKASGAAKAAISNWFKTTGRSKADVSYVILELFDRIYERPLWSIRSFLRSAIVSLAVTSVSIIQALLIDLESPMVLVHRYFAIIILTIILSDYTSLFVVRLFLRISRNHPVWSLVGGAITGMFVVLVFYATRSMLFFLADGLYTGALQQALSRVSPLDLFMILLPISSELVAKMISLDWQDPRTSFILPALAVHLWLPLFGIGVAFARAVNSFAWSVDKMQWFLKQGRLHPLQAIGYVAAVVIFISATTISILGRVLS
jgi:hypothetical protein